jgi:catechol 2,3-dioxygenase-like lactoylglutathione lyase family enzyme
MFKDTPAFSGYSIDNVQKAEQFYRDALGLDVEETKQGLNLKLKGTSVFLYPKNDHVPATFTVLNFAVEDIDSAVDKLLEKGIQFERYEGMHQDEKGIARGKAVGMGPDIAWFKDPAGNIVSVLEG